MVIGTLSKTTGRAAHFLSFDPLKKKKVHEFILAHSDPQNPLSEKDKCTAAWELKYNVSEKNNIVRALWNNFLCIPSFATSFLIFYILLLIF